jgi:hypothetical protein
MDISTWAELGAITAVFALFIKEVFAYMKSRKNGNGNGDSTKILNDSILLELQKMNNNHLHSIQECISEGNQQLMNTIHNDNMSMIKILGEISGKLDK